MPRKGKTEKTAPDLDDLDLDDFDPDDLDEAEMAELEKEFDAIRDAFDAERAAELDAAVAAGRIDVAEAQRLARAHTDESEAGQCVTVTLGIFTPRTSVDQLATVYALTRALLQAFNRWLPDTGVEFRVPTKGDITLTILGPCADAIAVLVKPIIRMHWPEGPARLTKRYSPESEDDGTETF